MTITPEMQAHMDAVNAAVARRRVAENERANRMERERAAERIARAQAADAACNALRALVTARQQYGTPSLDEWEAAENAVRGLDGSAP